MVNGPVSIEIERIVNLVRGFGWEMKSQDFTEPVITVVLTKTVTVGEAEASAAVPPT